MDIPHREKYRPLPGTRCGGGAREKFQPLTLRRGIGLSYTPIYARINNIPKIKTLQYNNI